MHTLFDLFTNIAGDTFVKCIKKKNYHTTIGIRSKYMYTVYDFILYIFHLFVHLTDIFNFSDNAHLQIKKYREFYHYIIYIAKEGHHVIIYVSIACYSFMVFVHVVFHAYDNLYFLYMYYIIFNEHKYALSKTSPLSLDV